MRLLDYLRLGFAGVKAHKKRAVTVVVIVGLLFGVIIAGSFVLQGLENAILGEMTAPTGGRVLTVSTIDFDACGEECDAEADVEAIKKNIAKYGGELIAAEVIQSADDVFYKLDTEVFAQAANDSGDAMRIVAPLATAVNIAGIKVPEQSAKIETKLSAIQKARAQTLHRVIESENGEEYYIAEILPGWMYTSNLSLGNLYLVGTKPKKNPLDLILAQIRTGIRQNFVTNDANTVETELIFAEFDDVEAAYNYYRDEVNYCSENDQMFGLCGGKYKYRVFSAVADPFSAYEIFQNVWLVFRIVAVVLAIIAVIIAISTYARLVNKDMKIVALYYAMGATGRQIRLVYMTYLLMLSFMAVAFALMVGLALAVGLSLASMTELEQIFALGLGVTGKHIWLVGWNNLIWCIIGALALVAILAIVLGNGNFRGKELARKLK